MKLNNVTKIYDGGVQAVTNLSLKCRGDDFLALVGPSGCGKSTLLRMIAGLEEITDGEVFFDDEKINNLHPAKRGVAMVFQNYALYPHKTVFDNMAFALKLERTPYAETRKKVESAAVSLSLENLLDRKPRFLSGGQRQRVALGRSLTREPKVFLFDEPLSNLDAKLRVSMRSEITRLHRQTRKLFVYVTHDQVEAMTMATKIAVIKNGVLQQFGEPDEIYHNPSNVFVARFIGSPPMNIFDGNISDGAFSFFAQKHMLSDVQKKRLLKKGECLVGFRPEDLFLSDSGVAAQVSLVENLGHEKIAYVTVDGNTVAARTDKESKVARGDTVSVSVKPSAAYFFDKNTQRTIINRTQKYFGAT